MGSLKIEKGKHITCIFENLSNIKNMMFKYYDKKENDNVFFVINYALTKESLNELRTKYNKIIYYNLEHLTAASYMKQSNIWREYFIDTLYCYDEIWDFLIENYNTYPDDLKDKYVFMPMRYVKTNHTRDEKIIDVFFAGVTDTPVRQKLASDINYIYQDNQISSVTCSGLFGENCDKMMQMSKFILDYPHYRLFGNTQNCVRIHDALCNNIQVISYTDTKRVINYFGDLIHIINPNKGFRQQETYDIVSKYKDVNVEEKYRELTEKENDYIKYRQKLIDTYF